MRERALDGLDVGGAEELGGEDLGGIGAGLPGGENLGGRERAAEDRHAVAAAEGDDVRAQGGRDDELGAGEDAGAGGLGVEHGAQAEEEAGQLGGGLFQHANGARGGHGELDAGEPAVGEGLGAVEQPVGIVGADQGNDLLGFDLGEDGIFFHAE